MKTVYTTFPIYKALSGQCVRRGRQNGDNTDYLPVFTPKHRLPSFQWIDDGDGAATVSSIILTNGETELDITSYFPTLPALYTSDAGDDYFIYNGDTLNYALPAGDYYLKITMDNDYVYFSEVFRVDCVYTKFASGFTNNSFDTFTISDMSFPVF